MVKEINTRITITISKEQYNVLSWYAEHVMDMSISKFAQKILSENIDNYNPFGFKGKINSNGEIE